MGMRIAATIIVSISVMMVIAILPVYASHAGAPLFTCPDNWTHIVTNGEDDKEAKDKNDNDHICEKVTNKGKVIWKDDHLDGSLKP